MSHSTGSEIHLLIIWNYALDKLDEIQADLEKTFLIRRHYRVNWQDHLFSSNLTRFYGQNLPPGSGKEAHCGRGPFHAFILEDRAPLYETRMTSRGPEQVNVNLFDAKAKYRDWTGGGHRIHATNSPEESDKDIWLLLHRTADSFRDELDTQLEEIQLDLIGAEGWQSLGQLFETLNELSNYVVMRNFECLPDQYFYGEHGDIDLLTDDLNNLVYISNAQKVFPQAFRVHYKIKIAGEPVLFDFRYLGDSYYDLAWSDQILQTRQLAAGNFYHPDTENHFYSMLYHALIHKPAVAEDYLERINRMGTALGLDAASLPDEDYQEQILKAYLEQQQYRVVEPVDHSVFFNRQRVEMGPLATLFDNSQLAGRIFETCRNANDLSVFSSEFLGAMPGSDFEYHFGRYRHCLLRPLGISEGDRVLELDCEYGALSRYLGETGAQVTALATTQSHAMLAKMRCRDLDNVEVISGSIDALTSRQFDWIILCGHVPDNLSVIAGLLSDSGKLAVAAENKFGVHAFNDTSPSGSDNWTFSAPFNRKNAVAIRPLRDKLVQAGLQETSFWYPFPDHTKPNVFLSDAGLSEPAFMPEELLAKNYAPSVDGSANRHFLDPLVLRELTRDGMLPEMAPAFLVVASLTPQNQASTPLALSYSVGRRPEFCTETRIEKQSGQLVVNKLPLFPDLEHKANIDGYALHQNLEQTQYIKGPLLLWPLTELRAKGGGVDELVSALQPWFSFLMHKAVYKSSGEQNRLADYWVEGLYQDCTPFNLIQSEQGLVYIDQEWQPQTEISLGWVVVRGIVHSILTAPGYEEHSLRLSEIVAQLCQVNNLVINDSEIEQWLAEEKQHLYVVSGLTGFNVSPSTKTLRIARNSHSGSQKGSAELLSLPGAEQDDEASSAIQNQARLSRFRQKDDVAFIQEMEDLVSQAMNSTSYSERKYIDHSLRKELESYIKLLNRESGLSMAMERCLDVLKSTLNHDDYQQWIARHELREVDAEVLAERMVLHWHQQPVMHCYMFVLPGEEHLLADTIDSLAGQLMKNWHLTVVGFVPAPDVIFEQAEFLHWRTLEAEEDPYDALNQEIARHPGHWVSFIEPGMQYSQQSLAKIADTINLNPGCSFIYTDDDQVDEKGIRGFPRFKPDFNLDLLRSSPYIGNGWVPAAHLIQAGGILALPGAENYELALRWFDTFGDSAFAHVADVLTHKSSEVDRPFDSQAGEMALQQHFDRQKMAVEIDAGYVDNSYRITYLHQRQPKVSIIIPTKDKLEFLQPCVESLLDKTTYPDYEVLVVDNQSTDPDTLSYYHELTKAYPDKVRVLSFDKPFNFSEMNNWAVQQATGEYLLLLNNDTEIVQPEWLDRMMNHGQREDVGVVGARLLYPESGRIQHAGVVLGMSEIADHPFNDLLTLNSASHMERARLDQNYSAVTAAVMLVKRDIYENLGGMDTENLAVLFNDVDFCLRVGEQGYRNVWTPFAIAIHHGSASLKSPANGFYFDVEGYAKKALRKRKEQRYMIKTWLPLLAKDPAYNKNLSLRQFEYNIDMVAPQNWDTEHHLRLRVYGLPVRGGAGDYRVKQPFSSLAKSGLALCEVGSQHLNITELERMSPDTVVVQNAISDKEIELLQIYREFKPEVQVVFMLDDLLHDLPEKSSQYRRMKAAYRDARSRLRNVLGYCDRLIVSTEPLAEMCADMIDDIEIIPNRLQKEKWLGLQSLRQQSSKPRVGWAGAQQHQGDLELIIDVVKETANEVDWVFFGMCPDEIKPYIREEHQFVDIEHYPQKLASLNLDLAIAPLEDNDFNRAKSNLRLLEYGIMGWPVICSDIFPYQTNNAPVTRVANQKAEWLAAIRQILADPVALQQAGDSLKSWVEQHYFLEDHMDEWFSALATAEFQADERRNVIAG